MKWIKRNWLWLVVNLIALMPLVMMLNSFNVDFSAAGLPQITVEQPAFREREFDREQAAPLVPEGSEENSEQRREPRERSPYGFLVHTTGEWGIRWLVFCLTCTPLYILFGWRSPLGLKKTLGLYAFLYAALHFLFFIVDEGWLATFSESNFILGLLSLLIMLPLALTSTDWAMQKLSKNWKLMHRAVYAAGVLAVLHLALLGEGSWLLYGVLLTIGFVVRVPQVRKNILSFRRRVFRHNPMPA
jgi:sulfoxide reductase heme-binding subunit YedZ